MPLRVRGPERAHGLAESLDSLNPSASIARPWATPADESELLDGVFQRYTLVRFVRFDNLDEPARLLGIVLFGFMCYFIAFAIAITRPATATMPSNPCHQVGN
jgi:hypothetical protein